MEACQESSPAPTGLEASSPAEGRHIDLTEDLAQQLEDIISTYQAAEIPAEPEDAEEVTAVKESDARKDQKLEKKMLKNLGGVLFFYYQNVLSIWSRGGFSFSAVSKSPSCTETDRCVSRAVMRVSASICNRRAGKIVFPHAFYSWLQLTRVPK